MIRLSKHRPFPQITAAPVIPVEERFARRVASVLDGANMSPEQRRLYESAPRRLSILVGRR